MEVGLYTIQVRNYWAMLEFPIRSNNNNVNQVFFHEELGVVRRALLKLHQVS